MVLVTALLIIVVRAAGSMAAVATSTAVIFSWGFLTDTTTNFGLNIGFLVSRHKFGCCFPCWQIIQLSRTFCINGNFKRCCTQLLRGGRRIGRCHIKSLYKPKGSKPKEQALQSFFSRSYPFITVKVRVFCRIFAIYGNTISMPF